MEYETLKYEQKDAIGILTLNRPECLNAINENMVEELEGFWMKKIICAIHKSAVGAGFSFTMASDVRIVTPEARFSAAYINIGLGGADVGSSYFLPRLIGAGRAYEFLLTGDFMDADEALRLGFVSRTVPYNDLMTTAMEMANKMVSKNPLGLRLTKEAINQNLDAGGLEQALQMENRNQALCMLANRLRNP